jgi:ketosteroid isomerase-like protein
MSAENVELARRGVEAWNSGDVEAMLELSTEDFEFVPAIAAGVEGGTVAGPEEFRHFMAALEETWESFRIDWDEVREVGARVLALGRVHAKGKGSGVVLDQPMLSVVWFRNGKVARMQSFLDRDQALEAASTELEQAR